MIKLLRKLKVRQSNLRKIKLVATDLDGTLLARDETITPRTSEAIAHLQEHGVQTMLVSGRSDGFTRRFSRQIRSSMPVISLNGALIKDASGNLMHASLIRPEWSHELLMAAEQYKDLSVAVFTHQGIYSEISPLNLPRYLNSCPEEHIHVQSVMPHLDNAVLLVFSGPIKAIQAISMASVQKFKSHMSRVVYQSRSGNGHYYMELRNAAPNKGYALRIVSHALGIARHEVAAIGDFMNDEEMLRWAGIAVAMRNASDDLKRLSDMVTLKTNDEDGVAEFLEYLYASRK